MDLTLDPLVNPAGPSVDAQNPINNPINNPNEASTPIVVAYMNCVGHTRLPVSKQLEIQSFVCTNRVDILHMQECKMDEDSFAQCGYLTSNFNLFSNERQSKLS